MAKEKEQSSDYSSEIKQLKEGGPGSLYLIHGRETYLCALFEKELKLRCVGEEDSFGYYRFDGVPELQELKNAVDTLPFLSERTFVEVLNADLSKLTDEQVELLKDIPDYCTLVFLSPPDSEPDKRTKAYKLFSSAGRNLCFESQSPEKLYKWIDKRFSALGKRITRPAAQRLVLLSGEYMNGLIPEIEKLASFTGKELVDVEEVNAVAHHLPEADAFELVNFISERRFNQAISYLSELLADKNTSSFAVLASLGYLFRQLWAVKCALDAGLGTKEIMGLLGTNSEYRAKLTIGSSKKYSKASIKNAVQLIALSEFRAKSSGISEDEILKDCVVRLIAEEQLAKTLS